MQKRNGSSHRWRQLRARVVAEETNCGLCGLPVDKTIPTPLPGSPEVDHIVPVSMGGPEYDRDNLTLSHRACNRAKSSSDTMPTTTKPTKLTTSRAW